MTDDATTPLEDRIRSVLTQEAESIPKFDTVVEEGPPPSDFDGFYASQRGTLYRALVLALRDRDLATEAVDYGMTRSYRKWRKDTSSKNPGSIAYAAAYAWASKRSGKVAGQSGFRLQRVDVSEATLEVQGAFSALPLSDRSLIVCRNYLRWETDAIAAAHDIDPASVERRFTGAIERLAQGLGVTTAEAERRVTAALRSEASNLVEPLGRAETVKGRAWLRRTTVALGSAAAVLVVVGGGMWGYQALTEEPLDPQTTATGTVTGATTRGPGSVETAIGEGTLEWSQVPLPITQGDISAIVAGPAGFVAFGQDYSGPGRSFALLSEDGFGWEPVSIPMTGQGWVNAAATTSNGYLVAATSYDERVGGEQTMLLSSSDGLNWESTPMPETPDFIAGMRVHTWTSINSLEVNEDGSVIVTAYRGGDIENLDAIIREVAPEGVNTNSGWGSSPEGVQVYDNEGNIVFTAAWDELGLDPEIVDALSGGLILWTAPSLGADWVESKLNIPGLGVNTWIADTAPVKGGFLAIVSGNVGIGSSMWRLDSATNEWSRVTIEGSPVITSIGNIGDTLIAGGTEGNAPLMVTSKDGGVSWQRVEDPDLVSGVVERLIASPGGAAAIISGNSFVTQEAILTIDGFDIAVTGGGIYKVTDAEGTVVTEVFAEDTVIEGDTITILHPDTGETLVSFSQHDVERAWEEVWSRNPGNQGPDYQIAISGDAANWTSFSVADTIGRGFYPQNVAINNGIVVLSGWQEEGGLIDRFGGGPPAPTLWVGTVASS